MDTAMVPEIDLQEDGASHLAGGFVIAIGAIVLTAVVLGVILLVSRSNGSAQNDTQNTAQESGAVGADAANESDQ
jgi:hypothetical protein